MGMFYNIMLFLFLTCIFFNVVGSAAQIDSLKSPIAAYFFGGTGANITDFPLYNLILITIALVSTLAVASTILPGSISFPNPYLIFSAITGVFLGFAIIPSVLFSGLPYPINVLLVGVLGWSMIIGVLDWWKGGREL